MPKDEMIIMNCDLPVVKIKKLDENSVLPVCNKDTDAGYDIIALGPPEIVLAKHSDDRDSYAIQYIQYRTGIAIEPQQGYHVEIFPRSSISKYDLMLANSIGLIDEGYRNEILVRFKYIEPNAEFDKNIYVPMKIYKPGDRIAQLVIRKTERVAFEWSEELSDSERGQDGFGSSGR